MLKVMGTNTCEMHFGLAIDWLMLKDGKILLDIHGEEKRKIDPRRIRDYC